jgi:hypothetical protein
LGGFVNAPRRHDSNRLVVRYSAEMHVLHGSAEGIAPDTNTVGGRLGRCDEWLAQFAGRPAAPLDVDAAA